METEKNPFEAVRAMMLEDLEKLGGATQSYIAWWRRYRVRDVH